MTANRDLLRRPIVSLLKLSAMLCLESTDPRFEAVMRFRRREMDEEYLAALKRTLRAYFYRDYRYDFYGDSDTFTIWSVPRRCLTYELCYYAVNVSAHLFRLVPRDIVDEDMIELARSMTSNVLDYFPYLRDELKTKEMVRAAVFRLPCASLSAVVVATPIEFRDSDFYDGIAQRYAFQDNPPLIRIILKKLYEEQLRVPR